MLYFPCKALVTVFLLQPINRAIALTSPCLVSICFIRIIVIFVAVMQMLNECKYNRFFSHTNILCDFLRRRKYDFAGKSSEIS